MKVRPLSIEHAFELTPDQFSDERGLFTAPYQAAALAEAIGHSMPVAQTNVSVSRRGALRGLHFSDVPPSQAKYVMAMSGTIVDFVVDVRVGSPTFGQWDSVVLDTRERRAVYVAEGLGHAMLALEEGSTAAYLCSTPFSPGREHGVHPLDPAIGLDLPQGLDLVLSEKDEAAPTLADARDQGMLPTYAACLAFYDSLT